MRLLCLVEHPGSHVLDLGFLLRTPLDAAATLAAQMDNGNGEYRDVQVVSFEALSARIEGLDTEIVPTALVFLRELGLLADRR